MQGHWFTFSPCRVARGMARMFGLRVKGLPSALAGWPECLGLGFRVYLQPSRGMARMVGFRV